MIYWNRMSLRREARRDAAQALYLLSGVIFLCGVFLLFWFFSQYVRSGGARLAIQGRVVGLPSAGAAEDSGAFLSRPDCPVRRWLDGLCQEGGEAGQRAVAVMLENSKDAWPISGVAAASVVYEAPVESNIPRLLAIFPADSEVPSVGPVRSARPYFVDWLGEYGADTPFFHVGGSKDALLAIAERDLFDIDEMRRGGRFFWRSSDREPPHNAYTKSDLWRTAVENLGRSRIEDATPSYLFATSTESCADDCVTDVEVIFSSPLYVARWIYDRESGRYRRLQRGEAFLDEDGVQVSADMIIIMRVESEVIDAIGRKRITTIGRGEATVFRDGRAISGRWRKRSAGSPMEWLDAAGNRIPLKSGVRWIEVATPDAAVEWKRS